MLNINTYYIVYTILHYIHICVIKLHICYDRYTEHDLMQIGELLLELFRQI